MRLMVLTVDYKAKYSQQLQSIKDNYKAFDQPYNGKDNDDYVNGQVCLKDIVGCTRESLNKLTSSRLHDNSAATMARRRLRRQGRWHAQELQTIISNDKDNYEKMQFYYHPDHLGSSSYITNLDGEVSQHIEYVPFGEVFIEERNNTWNTPYLFNAKEFDEETGMYYYGARYIGYVYTLDNLVKLVDTDGRIVNYPKNQRTKRTKVYYKKLLSHLHMVHPQLKQLWPLRHLVLLF